jgi:hypothetical protein
MGRGTNEGIRVLDDFVCEAIPMMPLPDGVVPSRAKNNGVQAVVEFEQTGPLLGERQDALRAMSNESLLDLIENNASALTTDEIRFVHDIALERLGSDNGDVTTDAGRLAREAMRIVVAKLAR